jgi:hypothetical protein
MGVWNWWGVRLACHVQRASVVPADLRRRLNSHAGSSAPLLGISFCTKVQQFLESVGCIYGVTCALSSMQLRGIHLFLMNLEDALTVSCRQHQFATSIPSIWCSHFNLGASWIFVGVCSVCWKWDVFENGYLSYWNYWRLWRIGKFLKLAS